MRYLISVCTLLCACLFTTTGWTQPRNDPAPEPVFDVWEYAVRGNTVLPADTIERAVYPYLGPARRIRDVEGARAALEQAYRKAGYGTVLVSIPEQAVDAGVVELEVVPGRVKRARVIGARYYDQGRILAKVSALAEGKVPNFNEAQSQLSTVNRLPGRTVTPLLRAGDEPGTTEVDFKVEERRPYGGNVALNNRRSPNTSPTRLSAGVRYDNLWQRQHAIGLQYQTAPQKPQEVKVWVLTYDAPSETSEDRYSFYAVRSRSNVAAVGNVSVLGSGSIYGARWVSPLRPDGTWLPYLTLGVDYKDFDEIVAQAGEPAIQTPIRYMPLLLSYEAGRADPHGSWRLGTGLNFAIRGLVSREAAFADKRFKARGNYVAWKWDVQRVQNLPRKFSAFLRFDGQLADQPLVSNEQFSAGGADTVRGYLESETLGDDAGRVTLELRAPTRTTRAPLKGGRFDSYLFSDFAALRVKDPLPGQKRSYQIWGTGLGLRYQLADWRFALEAAWPLRATQETQNGEPRLHFEVKYDF